MALIWLIPVAGLAAVFYAGWLTYDVLRRDTGTAAMQDVASTIFEGAMAFLRRQYTTIAILALVTSVLIGILIALIPGATLGLKPVQSGQLGLMTSIAFLLGASCSALSGFIGMFVAVQSN